MGRGGSGSHFFSCDDNQEYIVKFVDNTKTVVNELVAALKALIYNITWVYHERELKSHDKYLCVTRIGQALMNCGLNY